MTETFHLTLRLDRQMDGQGEGYNHSCQKDNIASQQQPYVKSNNKLEWGLPNETKYPPPPPPATN